MKRSAFAIILLILIACAAFGVFMFGDRTTPPKHTGPLEKLTIGSPLFDVSGLLWVAEDQGYFAENGLDARIEVFDAGKYAVNALLEGKVDIAAAAEFVLVGKTMKDEKLLTFGSIAKSELHYLIGRKDKGIEKDSDLKGKRIGVPMQTSAEFYLGRYLQLHGAKLDEVTIVDLAPTLAEESIIRGDVDAVCIWDPYAYPIEKKLGANAAIWPAQSGQMMYWLLIARREYVTGHPKRLDRLLRSFAQAEAFVVNNPYKAKEIVRDRIKVAEAYMGRVWPNTRLALSLDQGLIIAMEDESRWMIDNKLTGKLEMPYYPDHIHWQGLQKVKPSSVTLIH